ncbi:CE1759 family FMN reductase [Propionibacteriaceae bacterium G1746]|uniref:CE1759 family FMN reductase n=1 Tax=Aestuariimicrobium sp. G57 TaxID=3418485 RepID=UPI003C28FADB
MTRRIVLLQAGLRNPSTTRMLAEELEREIKAAFEHEGYGAQTRIVDIRDHAHAIVDTFMTGFSGPELQDVLDAVIAADALVVVTPTFSASYSGLFKSFMDIVEPEALVGKPVVLAATGGSERHSLMIDHALRPLFAYLGADPVRTGIFAATGDFGGTDGQLTARVRRAARELVGRVCGAGVVQAGSQDEGNGPAHKANGTPRLAPAKGFGDDVVPFEQMMSNLGVGR